MDAERAINKDFPGAKNVVKYFGDGKFSPYHVALVFGPPGMAKELTAVLTNDKWSAKTVKVWRGVIAAHERHRKMTRETRAREGTEINTQEKPVKFKVSVTKKTAKKTTKKRR